MRRSSAMAFAALALALSGFAQDSESLRSAKALAFDGKYVEARQAWQQILAAGGPSVETAAYWVARCSENLKEDARAFKEYGDYLARRPADHALEEQARTSRVALGTRLYRAGQAQQLPFLKEALADSNKTVRYYAAFQLGGLGGEPARSAVPLLKRIVAEEKDQDLVDRAKLILLRVDPQALAGTPAPAALQRPTPTTGHATWLKVRVFEGGTAAPKVSVNVPVALAEIVFKSLPEDAKKDLRLKGYDAENFWERLKSLPKTEILTIEGEDGEKVQIWIE